MNNSKAFGLKTVLLFSFLFAVFTPVWANSPPSPQAFLTEVLLLPLMILFSYLGGYYVVHREEKKESKKSSTWIFIAAVILILFSASHEGWAMIFGICFALLACYRGLEMLYFSFEGEKRKERAMELGKEPVSSLRLGLTGGVLILIAAALGTIPVVFVGYNAKRSGLSITGKYAMEDFLAYQEAYFKYQLEKTGEGSYHLLTDEDFSKREEEYRDRFQFQSLFMNEFVTINYGKDGKSFEIYLTPNLPPFPYNTIASLPSYYLSEKGKIRKEFVSQDKEKCSPQAPVVWQKEGQKNYREKVSYYYEMLKKKEEKKSTKESPSEEKKTEKTKKEDSPPGREK